MTVGAFLCDFVLGDFEISVRLVFNKIKILYFFPGHVTSTSNIHFRCIQNCGIGTECGVKERDTYFYYSVEAIYRPQHNVTKKHYCKSINLRIHLIYYMWRFFTQLLNYMHTKYLILAASPLAACSPRHIRWAKKNGRCFTSQCEKTIQYFPFMFSVF